jgi:hypothetical protein
MKFKASPDKLTKIITTALLALLLALPLFKLQLGWASLLLGAIFFFCFALSPRNYELTATELKINRLFKPVRIPVSQIKNVELITEPEKLAKNTIRTFGVGGLFGYFGKFWHAELGNMTWYLKNFKNVLLIELTEGRKILLSPDDASMAEKMQDVLRQPVKGKL